MTKKIKNIKKTYKTIYNMIVQTDMNDKSMIHIEQFPKNHDNQDGHDNDSSDLYFVKRTNVRRVIAWNLFWRCQGAVFCGTVTKRGGGGFASVRFQPRERGLRWSAWHVPRFGRCFGYLWSSF